MIKHNVDLIVIEGMGRTLHTNLYAKMKCECLKLAVVKNRWLAKRLGGDMYAVICKYEKETSKLERQNYGVTPTDNCNCKNLNRNYDTQKSTKDSTPATNSASLTVTSKTIFLP